MMVAKLAYLCDKCNLLSDADGRGICEGWMVEFSFPDVLTMYKERNESHSSKWWFHKQSWCQHNFRPVGKIKETYLGKNDVS